MAWERAVKEMLRKQIELLAKHSDESGDMAEAKGMAETILSVLDAVRPDKEDGAKVQPKGRREHKWVKDVGWVLPD